MPPVADEVEPGRGLMASHARHAIAIGYSVSLCSEPDTLIRDIEHKKLPAVCKGEFLGRMLDHRLVRKELKNRAHGIIRVRHAVFKNTRRLLQLSRISVSDVRVSDFG